jgi:hypothetical protein
MSQKGRTKSLGVMTMAFLFCGGLSFAQELPTVAVYPFKDIENDTVREIVESNDLDLNIIVLKTGEALRASKKMQVFERNANTVEKTVRTEQSRAACSGNSAPVTSKSSNVGTANPSVEGSVECAPLYKGNAADSGKLENVEFIIELSIKELSIGDVFYRPFPEVPGKFRGSYNARLDLVVKLLDSTSAEIKVQKSVQAIVTNSWISSEKGGVDKREIWSQLANETGRKAAAAILGVMKN